jgi:hypothetical protein
VFLVLIASIVTLLSASTSYIALGSDSGVRIYTPAMLTKALSLVAVAGAWVLSAVRGRTRAWLRWTSRGAGLIVLAMATHVVTFNYKRGVVEEHWFAFRFDRAPFDRADGIHQDWLVREFALGIALKARHADTERFIFTGFSPWMIDLEPSLRAP